MSSSTTELHRRCSELTAQIAKLVEADVKQRRLIIGLRRYLHLGQSDPVRMRYFLAEIEEVLGRDGLTEGADPSAPATPRLYPYARKGVAM